MQQQLRKSRPWPVYVLVLSSLVGLAWGAIVDPDRNLWDLVGLVLTAWITYSLWVGKSRVTLIFMLVTLSLAVGGAAGIIAVALLQDLPAGALWGTVTAVALIGF